MVRPEPAVDPLEVRQREAMDQADQRRAAGDLTGAAALLQSAAALNGPLSAEIQKKQAEIQAEINDGCLRSLRQKEEQAWQNAKKDVDAGRFSSAEKYLATILALPEGGLRKDDARKYQDQVIPQRKKEETLWARAKKDSGKNDVASLKQADDTLAQVIQLGGPRKSEAVQLRQNVDAKLEAKAPPAAAVSPTVTAVPQGTPKLPQGPTPEAIEAQDWTRANSATEPAQLEDYLKKYPSGPHAADAQSKLQDVLWARTSRDDAGALQAYVSRFPNAPHSAEASRRIEDILYAKLDRNDRRALTAFTNQYPNSTHHNEIQSILNRLDLQEGEKKNIQATLDSFNAAFEHQQPKELKEIWPTATTDYLNALRQPGGYKVVMTLQTTGDPVILSDTAMVPCNSISKTTKPGGEVIANQKPVQVRLRKTKGRWLINGFEQ